MAEQELRDSKAVNNELTAKIEEITVSCTKIHESLMVSTLCLCACMQLVYLLLSEHMQSKGKRCKSS